MLLADHFDAVFEAMTRELVACHQREGADHGLLGICAEHISLRQDWSGVVHVRYENSARIAYRMQDVVNGDWHNKASLIMGLQSPKAFEDQAVKEAHKALLAVVRAGSDFRQAVVSYRAASAGLKKSRPEPSSDFDEQAYDRFSLAMTLLEMMWKEPAAWGLTEESTKSLADSIVMKRKDALAKIAPLLAAGEEGQLEVKKTPS